MEGTRMANNAKDTKPSMTAMTVQHGHGHTQRRLSVEVMTQLETVGITTEEWLDANTSDTTMALRLFTVLSESLAEMERLASVLEAYQQTRHDPYDSHDTPGGASLQEISK